MVNVAKMFFDTRRCNARVAMICDTPTNVIVGSSSGPVPAQWNEFFDQAPYYNRIICVKRANIMPFVANCNIICTFLPFFHAAVLLLRDDDLRCVLLIGHMATMNWLLRDFAPMRATEVIDVCRPPQIEPNKFDRGLDTIYSFKNYRVQSKPVWESAILQAEAHGFQRNIQKHSMTGDNFSGPITYRLCASDVQLEIPYESYMIFQTHGVITLVQNDRVAST